MTKRSPRRSGALVGVACDGPEPWLLPGVPEGPWPSAEVVAETDGLVPSVWAPCGALGVAHAASRSAAAVVAPVMATLTQRV